jgi:hypothetical protein
MMRSMICSVINANIFLEKDLDLSSVIQHFTLFVVINYRFLLLDHFYTIGDFNS